MDFSLLQGSLPTAYAGSLFGGRSPFPRWVLTALSEIPPSQPPPFDRVPPCPRATFPGVSAPSLFFFSPLDGVEHSLSVWSFPSLTPFRSSSCRRQIYLEY